MTAKFRQLRLDDETRLALMKQAKELDEQGLNQREIAKKLQVSQPTVCQWLRKIKLGLATRLQERVAAKIRAELVCCDIYQRMEALRPGSEGNEEWHKLKRSNEYHDICYYGEWSARIAEQVK